jgi:hypothetical protein
VKFTARQKKFATIAAEVALVLVIVGLLIAIWMPALIGGNPNAPVR